MMRTPAFWAKLNLLAILLIPASWVYRFVSGLRSFFIRPKHIGIPVICVGNLVAGGAGKTPVAIAVAQLLAQRGKQVFFISRGYGGQRPGPLLVDLKMHSLDEVGDEALLLAQHATTIIGKDRIASARLAKSQGAQVIIMDDGFQNPYLHKDVSLVVVDGTYGFGNGLLLPAGPLREPIHSGLKRAQAVVRIGEDYKQIGDYAGKLPVISARMKSVLKSASDSEQNVLVAFAGIARPEKFFESLQENYQLVEVFPFADHHAYEESEVERLLQAAKHHQAGLATTTKDAVRIPKHLHSSLMIFDAEISFDHENELTTLLAPIL